MKYYEGGFFANFKYWVRYYDTEIGKAFLTDDVPQKWEYYVPDETGNFTSIYNGKKFRRERGSSNRVRRSHRCVPYPVRQPCQPRG